MIDPKKLPARALVDSGILIFAYGHRAAEPLAKPCRGFMDEMLRAKHDVLIATPTITEITRNTDYPAVPIPSVAHVVVVSFDMSAAILLAQKFPEQVIRNVQKETGLFLDYIKYDALILACAARYEATLVTVDDRMSLIAKRGGIACNRVEEFEEAQLSLGQSRPPSPGSG